MNYRARWLPACFVLAAIAVPLALLPIPPVGPWRGLSWVHAQPPLRVRVDRWIELRAMGGTVNWAKNAHVRLAQLGDRLQTVGDWMATGQKSSAQLALDTGMGFIAVGENTQLRVMEMRKAPDNGRITRLAVSGGRVRLKMRKFTNPGSRLEIQTPTGVSGVRGTDFGLGVQPSGKTAVAVLEGGVATQAQGKTVAVPGGFQNLTMPGEPPSPPEPLRDDTALQTTFEQQIQRGVRQVRLIGQVDPVNTVTLNGVPQTTDRTGRFSTDLKPVSTRLRFTIVVTTPLGKEQTYDLAPP
jgi:hypothetical protein